MTGDDRDLVLLRQAVDLALGNATHGQLPFGAVVARGDDVLATGVNTALRDHDPAAHAEVGAIRAACRTLGTLSLAGSTLYTSCEPCPICHAVAITADVERIVYAAPRQWVPDLGTPSPQVLVAIQGAARERDPGRFVFLEMQEARAPFDVYVGHLR